MVNMTLPIVVDMGEGSSLVWIGFLLFLFGLMLCSVAIGMWAGERGRRKSRPVETPAALPVGVEGFPIPWPDRHVSDEQAATPFSHRGRHKADAGDLEAITMPINRNGAPDA